MKPSLTTSPATTFSRHPFTTAVAGKAGRPGSDTTTILDTAHIPPRQGLTYAELVAVEARLAGALRRGEAADDGPADAATAAALGLATGRTNGHALGVVRADIEAVEDAVRSCHLARSRPEPGDRLYVPATDR
jgi:hypothetical protein